MATQPQPLTPLQQYQQRHKSSSKGRSHMQLVGSKGSSVLLRRARERLQLSLPRGWQNFFDVRRAGKYWGLPRTCKICGARPGVEVPEWNRWRWVAAHVLIEHV